ncbi:MAG: DUF4838 domain-containing protein [Candidatus Borkfalkiaceae bacterium]|nr:DUF4838 domain-containing protein [Clostridia bacterium]MDY6224096.1 DUF4838 domain-containing protein [Christensenellaceae bacterium]
MNFVTDGNTNYCIKVPQGASSMIGYAASELQTLFAEATGAALSVGDGGERFVSLGRTEEFINAGYSVTEAETGKTGFIIKTDDKGNVFIAGSEDVGTLNGVYGFLEKTLNFDCFTKGVYHIDKVSELSFMPFNLTEKPSFDYRQVNYAELREDETTYRRMRMQPAPEQYVTGNAYHNSIEILTYKRVLNGESKDDVIKEYTASGWINNGQLCYSAADMRAAFIESLKLYLQSKYCNLSRNLMVIGMEDAVTWCDCSACGAAPSKVYAEFMNAVAEAINAERESAGESPVTFLMFAYYYTLEPPKGVTLNKNVGVLFAPIKARFTLGLTDAENAMYETALAGWAALTDNLYGWTYNAYFGQTLVMYDTFGVLQENYKLLLKYGVKGLYDQTESYMAVSSGFGRLKGYLQSKLLWNVNADAEALTDKFFNAVYGNAAETMKTVFNETRAYYKHLYETADKFNGQTGLADSDKRKYSEGSVDFAASYACLQSGGSEYAAFKTKLEGWISALNTAKSAAAAEEAERIKLETLQYRYLYLRIYGETDTITKADFKTDIDSFGILYYKEGKKVTELWQEWGLE